MALVALLYALALAPQTAPLVLELCVFGLMRHLDDNDILAVILSDSPLVLMYGVGVGLSAVFGSADPIRWRGYATAIGALSGLGFALTYALVAIVNDTTLASSCSETAACGWLTAFQAPTLNVLGVYALEALALALVGALVGGWLRASAPPAPPARFVDIAG